MASDNNYASMTPDENIELKFAVPASAGEVRDFVLVSKGYYEPTGTYFIYTWDGSKWAQRDGWSVAGSGDQTQTFDLSMWMPDPAGEYKVRIWQDFWYDPAGINYVGLTQGATSATMIYATDLRKSLDVTSLLAAPDGSRDEWGPDDSGYPYTRSRNRWVEVKWTGLTNNNPPTTNPVSITDPCSATPTISWTYADADSDVQQQYEVQVWTGTGGSGTNMWNPGVATGTVTSVPYAGSALVAGETYYARVRAFDGKSWGGWSEQFWTLSTTCINKPPTTNPVSITDPCSTTPTISWTYADADSDVQQEYEVQVWTGTGGSGTNMWNPGVVPGTITSVQYAGSPLVDGETYYALVRAFDGKNWGEWSEVSWTYSTTCVPTPEFPSVFIPAAMIIGLTGAVFLIHRRREH